MGRIVERPVCRPMRCAAMPHIGQMTRTRWVDTGSEMQGPDDHVYLSEVAVTEYARDLFGWSPPGEIRQLARELAEVRAQLMRTVGERDAARAKLAAIDVIESEGFRARKKPGRPTKEAVA